MDELDRITQAINTEVDRRKLQKLVDTGVITAEELQAAPIIQDCCGNMIPICDFDGTNIRCKNCGKALTDERENKTT